MNKEDLVKVSVSHGEYYVSIKVPRNVFNNNTEEIVNALKLCLNAVAGEELEYVQKPKKQSENVTSVTPVKDDFKIRERIPNNVVDVKDLDIKQAITEKALVRCPHCGQSHILALNSGNRIYVMRKFYAYAAEDEFRIILEFDSLNSHDFLGICCKPETDRKAYFEDIQKTYMKDDKDFAVTNDTEVFCPVCCQSDTFLNWKNAYDNPLEYFETEHLCDACGGETVTKMVKKQKVTKCEKCGHETKYEEK